MDGEGTGVGGVGGDGKDGRMCGNQRGSRKQREKRRGTFSISHFSGASYSRSTSPDHNPLTDREIN